MFKRFFAWLLGEQPKQAEPVSFFQFSIAVAPGEQRASEWFGSAQSDEADPWHDLPNGVPVSRAPR